MNTALDNFSKLGLVISFAFFSSCGSNPKDIRTDSTETIAETPGDIRFNVVRTLPHDTSSYTEGLLFHDGTLFESTGHTASFPNTRSLFGTVDPVSGKIDKKVEIDKRKYFGEGIVFLKNRVYQITDTTHIGFMYDPKTYKQTGSFVYAGEGWGLTTNGTDIWMSNGSNNIYHRDPETFKITKTLAVTDNNGPVGNLNELELIKGYLYANQWLTNYVLKIDTTSGKVLGRLDLSLLKAAAMQKYPGAEETNGIAYDPVRDKIFVTGKLWPSIYEIQFDH